MHQLSWLSSTKFCNFKKMKSNAKKFENSISHILLNNNVKLSVACNKHIFSCFLACRLPTGPLTWVWLSQARGQSSSLVQVSSTILTLGTRAKQLLLNVLLFMDHESMGVTVETQDASSGFCWQLAHCRLPYSPLTKEVISTILKSAEQKFLPPTGKALWSYTAECAHIIPVHGGRDPVSSRITSCKLLQFCLALCTVLDRKLFESKIKM